MMLKNQTTRLLLVTLSLAGGVTAFSANAKKAPRRIAIIGTGIGGLSIAHSLTNSPLLEQEYGSFPWEVSMFEARKKLDTKAGAGVQLNGGLTALGKINPSVQRAVLDAGLPVSQIKSRSKPWFGESKPYDSLLELNLSSIVRKAGGAVSQELFQDGELLWSAIMRGSLQDALWKTLPASTKRKVKFNKALVGIVPQSDGSAVCEFSDGTTAGPFDVIIGSDGVNSACKQYIETGKISGEPSKQAIYSGLRIKYAVDDAWIQKDTKMESSAVLKQYFGDGGDALDGTYGNGAGKPRSRIAFFVFLDEDYRGPFRKKQAAESAASENADWREGEKRNREMERKAMIEGMNDFNIPSVDLDPIVNSADRFFELGIYFHNPFSLAGWSKTVAGKDSAVVALCGDAAHTIPPFLGQGSNQAIQDAYCLVSKLYEYNANIAQGVRGPGLDALLKEYERTRWFHTFVILLNTIFLGYLETGGENGFYSKFRDLFFRITGAIGIAQRVLLSAATPKV